jgi:ribosomal protein L19
MKEDDLIELGFEKIEYGHYYNYERGDLLSCDNDDPNRWFIVYQFSHGAGVVHSLKLLKQLIKRIDEINNAS